MRAMDEDDRLIEPRPADRRHQRRQRVLKGALVVLGDHLRAFDCTIRNLTEVGAKIDIETTLGIPDEFEIFVQSTNRIAPARTIWRNDHEIGIELTGPWRHHDRTI